MAIRTGPASFVLTYKPAFHFIEGMAMSTGPASFVLLFFFYCVICRSLIGWQEFIFHVYNNVILGMESILIIALAFMSNTIFVTEKECDFRKKTIFVVKSFGVIFCYVTCYSLP